MLKARLDLCWNQITTNIVDLFYKCPNFLLFVLQDPEVMVAFQDVAQNPANMSKYQNNPKVMNLISKLSAKFGSKP